MTPPTINDNEVLFRQLGENLNPIYFDPDRNPLVHQSVFLPTRSDADGLSLIRSQLRTEIWSAYRLEQPTRRFRLARLQATRLRLLAVESGLQGLSFLSSPDRLDIKHGEPWAHCAVVEINRIDYDNDRDAKKRIKEWAMQAANIVTNRDVIGPFPEPTDDDPYRPANMQV